MRCLSGEPEPKFEPPIVPRKRYFTMPQPLKHYSFYYDAPKYDAAVIYEQIFKPKTFSTKSESATAQSEGSGAKLEITQAESQITTSQATTSGLQGTGLQMTTVSQDSDFKKVPERTIPIISFYRASEEEHRSQAKDKEHASHEEHVSAPDPFEGILQPILLGSWSSSSTIVSQSPEENEAVEQREYRSLVLQTTEPRDIPRTDKPVSTTIETLSKVTRLLQSFESRIQNRQLRMEEPERVQESGGRGEPDNGNDSAANEASQISPDIAASTSLLRIPQLIVTSEASAPSDTQITSEVRAIEEQMKQLTTSSEGPTSTSRQISLSAEQQQQQSSAKTSGKFGRLVFSEPRPPTPPPSAKSRERLIFPEPKPPTPPPLVTFTPFGPKIVNFTPITLLKGAVASPTQKKRVTFSDQCIYWPFQSTARVRTRFPRQRSRQRSNRPPPPSLKLSPEQSPERKEWMTRSRKHRQPPTMSQYEAIPHQIFFYSQQPLGQKQSLVRRRRKLAQRKLLRRSFSTPRQGAVWPLFSLTRESPYFIYNVLRRASAPSERVFGRRFLSAHSSAEDLYDEAAERAFPDPWAARRTGTMLNTFPLTPLYPKEKARVPWIRFQWPRAKAVTNK